MLSYHTCVILIIVCGRLADGLGGLRRLHWCCGILLPVLPACLLHNLPARVVSAFIFSSLHVGMLHSYIHAHTLNTRADISRADWADKTLTFLESFNVGIINSVYD